jgi:hypothetical protein
MEQINNYVIILLFQTITCPFNQFHQSHFYEQVFHSTAHSRWVICTIKK